jgi:hypothetical protein
MMSFNFFKCPGLDSPPDRFIIISNKAYCRAGPPDRFSRAGNQHILAFCKIKKPINIDEL